MADILKVLSKQVFEIRFKENSTVMDFRGLWTKRIAEKLRFNDWNIDANEVTIIDKPSKSAVFLSYKHLGAVTIGENVSDNLPKLAEEYMGVLYDLEKFSMTQVRRLGVRCQYLIASNRSFGELRDSYNTVLLNNWQGLQAEIGGKIDDTGIVLEIVSDQFDYKVNLGPMLKGQASQFMPDFTIEELPDVALYIDVDTKKKDIAHIDRKTLTTLVAKYFANNSFQMETFSKMIGVHSDVKEEETEKVEET